jgi:hypothetical protein
MPQHIVAFIEAETLIEPASDESAFSEALALSLGRDGELALV